MCFRGVDLRRILRYHDDERYRGRSRGRKSKSDKNTLDSIALIAAKYELDPRLLLDAFRNAWINQESMCGALKIERRGTDENANNFLVTLKDKVISQFPIETNILERPDLFESSLPVIQVPTNRKQSRQMHIEDLRAKMRGVSLTARVVEVPPKGLIHTRYDEESFVSNILLADDTGNIRLSLWNSRIDDVAVGDTLKIENAKVAMFQGELQLRISRDGTMSVDTSTRHNEHVLIKHQG